MEDKMAQGRVLKRKITRSKKMAALKSDKARLLWFYMLPFTDVDGRIGADAEDIRDEIIRKQRKGFTVSKIEECLNDLHRVGLIILYSVNGKEYLEFTKHSEEQNLRRDKEAKSEIPPLSTGQVRDKGGSSPALNLTLSDSNSHSKDIMSKGKKFVPPTLEEVKKYIEDNPELSNVDPDTFWKGFNDSGWIDTRGNPVRNWKLKLRTWSSYDSVRTKNTGSQTQRTADRGSSKRRDETYIR